MDARTRSEIEHAIKFARAAIAKLEALLPKHIEVPKEIAELVAQRLANRICLSCLKPIPHDEPDRRGNHVTCYSTQRARIRSGAESEEDLVLAGKLTAEAKKPGRKAALDEAAEQLAKTMIAADKKDQYDPQGKRPRKKRS